MKKLFIIMLLIVISSNMVYAKNNKIKLETKNNLYEKYHKEKWKTTFHTILKPGGGYFYLNKNRKGFVYGGVEILTLSFGNKFYRNE